VLAAEEKDYVMDALSELSIDGYLSMGTPLEVYSKAIQAVVGGELWLPRSIIIDAYRGLVQRLKHQAAVDVQEEQPTSQLTALTEREKLVSKMIANGLANKEIAREMGVSINTVKKHLKNIYGKCNVSRRSQIAPLLYQGAAA
jgi:DNA-binding NarL/FixJ family response regulator